MPEDSWVYSGQGGFDRVGRASVELEADGSITLGFDTPGPAGTASVVFPDGSSWTVDEADPSALVQIHLPGGSDDDWRLARLLLGPDADELRVRVEFPEQVESTQRQSFEPPIRPGRTPQGFPGDPAARAGALVVAADLATSRSEPMLARIAGAVVLVAEAGFRPALRAFDPITRPALELAERLSEVVGVDDVESLGSEVRRDLASVIGRVIREHDGPLSGLERLAARLRGDELGATRPLDEDLVLASPMSALGVGEPLDHLDGGSADLDWSGIQTADLLVETADGTQSNHQVQVEWVEDLRLRITIPGTVAPDVEWVAVLRSSDLLRMALAPVTGGDPSEPEAVPGASGSGERFAEAVIPSGYSVSDLQFVARPGQRRSRGESMAELFRDAVESGRHAARLTRAALGGHGDPWPPEIEAAWRDCARAWDAVGDHPRSKLASMYASGFRRAAVAPDLGLPDRVALELVRWG